jgi:stringent starvation protein B
MHEWMVDNGFTPHLVVDARREGVNVPIEHVQDDGRIMLNVSHHATKGLSLGNEFVSFEARFGGVARQLDVPVAAVLGIITRETQQGLLFGEEPPPPGTSPAPPTPPSPAATPSGGADKPPKPSSKPKLKVVK